MPTMQATVERVRQFASIAKMIQMKPAAKRSRITLTADGNDATPIVEQLRALLGDYKHRLQLLPELKRLAGDDGMVNRKEWRLANGKFVEAPAADLNQIFNELIEVAGGSHGELSFEKLRMALLGLQVASRPASPGSAASSPVVPEPKRAKLLSLKLAAPPAKVLPPAPPAKVLPPARTVTYGPTVMLGGDSMQTAVAATAVAAVACVSPLKLKLKRGPLSAKSKSNLDRWTELALQERLA